MATPKFIDCCARPELEGVRTLYESTHDLESVLRCTRCETFWFYRFNEYVDYAGGDDDLTSWYTQLTTAEGERLRDTTNPSGEDTSFLRNRPAWMHDARGTQRVGDSPDHPFG
ncbi:hypothetical protein ACFQ1S_17865 [Kibdelosporangium lantanae]|uniref:Uncharacterized protein n=1 Tax=Kibdelosporangium lantanae TaxID=1497396 RepID=A0ABW3M981_9PSEU